ncbi:hypothetical protein MKW94_016224 [Papaver nudicaule]|uniref:SnoaL-like domain-containing protein n=1 Tax=Papaver nudicaule TaxID=74823 RepID=A0AA41S0R4_PAPNU|nr:hypothetical protein [Papaver nudicaule]
MATYSFRPLSISSSINQSRRLPINGRLNPNFPPPIVWQGHVNKHGNEIRDHSEWKMVHSRVSAKNWLIMSLGRNTNFQPSPASPSDTIQQFYKCINTGDWRNLPGFLAQDCVFEDYTFSVPFEGEKEIMQFFAQLTEAMGKNVNFVIEHICRGDESTITTMWHLEWNSLHIPFTRGCSFFECIKQGDRFLIKRARIINESPLKPGAMALTLLKLVTSLFDEFPRAAEKFLQKPYAVLQFLLRIYKLFAEPFIHPVLVFYTKLWKFLAQLVSYALNILFSISRIFFR